MVRGLYKTPNFSKIGSFSGPPNSECPYLSTTRRRDKLPRTLRAPAGYGGVSKGFHFCDSEVTCAAHDSYFGGSPEVAESVRAHRYYSRTI